MSAKELPLQVPLRKLNLERWRFQLEVHADGSCLTPNVLSTGNFRA